MPVTADSPSGAVAAAPRNAGEDRAYTAGQSALYARLLSRLYDDAPDAALLEALAAAPLAQGWPFVPDARAREAFLLLEDSLRASTAEDLAGLREDHLLLFIGCGMPRAPLWGSVYLDEENLLMRQSTLDLEAFYRAAGLVCTLPDRRPLDHLGLCLSALAVLLERCPCGRAEEDGGLSVERWEVCLQELLERHLGPWVFRCATLCRERAVTPLYKAVGGLTESLFSGLLPAFQAQRIARQLFY